MYYVSSVPVKVVRGIFEEELLSAVDYESSIPLLYEVNIPIFKPHMQSNQKSSLMIKALNEIQNKAFDNLMATIPIMESNEKSNSKFKRSLDFIGDFEERCCGVATEKNLQDIVLQEATLERFGKNMEKQITKDHVEVIQMSKILNNYSVNVDHVIKEIENSVGRNFNALASAEKTNEEKTAENSNSILNLAQSWLDSVIATSWQKITSDCQKQLIPHMIVTPKLLNEDLKNVSRILRRNKQKLAIPVDKIGRYFQMPLASCTFSEDKLIINVKIPIKREKVDYKIKSIKTIPFQHNNQICILQLDSNLIAVGDNKFVMLTDKNQCNVKENGLCFIPIFTNNPSTFDACIKKMLNPLVSVDILTKSCIFICNDKTDDTIITHINKDEYAVVNNEELSIRCKGKKEEIIPKLEKIGVHQVKVPCHCTLSGSENYITPKYPCSSRIEDSSIHHVIPAAWSKMQTAINTENALFSNLSEVFHENWHHTAPIMNMSIKPLETFEWDYMPHTYKIGTHMSFFSTFWMAFLTVWVIWLTWKFLRVPVLIPIIPRVNCQGEALLVLESFEDAILMTIVILLIILISMIKKYKKTIPTVFYRKKCDETNIEREIKMDANGEISINIFKNDDEEIT